MKQYKRETMKWIDFQTRLNFMADQGWKLHSWNVTKDLEEEIIVLVVWEK